MNRILRCALALAHTVIEYVHIEGDRVVVGVRPALPDLQQEMRLLRQIAEALSSWRVMDLARSMCYLKYALHRVRWPEHGVLVESMPWARCKARFMRDFKEWVVCLALYGSGPRRRGARARGVAHARRGVHVCLHRSEGRARQGP